MRIGDLPQMTQSKILRVLQEKELRRLGGRDAIKVDVRIIAATNKDIEKEIKKGPSGKTSITGSML